MLDEKNTRKSILTFFRLAFTVAWTSDVILLPPEPLKLRL